MKSLIGIPTGLLNSNYLRLDCSNDPLTNTLDGADFDFTGHGGLGTDGANTAAVVLDIDETFTFVDSTRYGCFLEMDLDTTGAMSAATHLIGWDAQARWVGAHDGSVHASIQGIKGEAVTWDCVGDCNQLVAMYGKANNLGQTDVTEAIGVLGYVANDNASTNDGSITNAYSFLASADATKTTGLIDTRYGLYVEDIATAAHTTNQYGIYCPALVGAITDNLFIKNVSAASDFGSGDIDTTGTLTATTITDGTTTLTGGSLTVVKLGTLTTNGFVKTSGADGTLSIDTSTYLTAEADTLDTVADRGATTDQSLTAGGFTDSTATLTSGALTGLASAAITTTGKLQFRDAQIYIASLNDGYLDLEADTEIRLNADVRVTGNAFLLTENYSLQLRDAQIYVNSDNDGYLDLHADTAIRINGAYELPAADGTANYVLTTDGSGTVTWAAGGGGAPEGTAVLSTGEGAGTKFLREDGDGTCSWQNSAAGISFGLENEIPSTNATVDGFDYSSNLIFDGTTLNVGPIEIFFDGGSGDSTRNINIGNAVGNLGTVTGGRSIIIGYQAGQAQTSPYDNVFVGYRAGYANTSGQQNTFVGAQAGQMLSGSAKNGNTFVGYTAGRDSDGVSNTGLGLGTLAKATGGYNTGVGRGALAAVVAGANNVAAGYNAGSKITSGVANICLGNASGSGITTGSSALAIGASTMGGTYTGARAIAIGNSALNDLTSGGDHVCIGEQAGAKLTTLSSCTIIGSLAGITTTAAGNTFVGAEAGRLRTSGGTNTFVGLGAGRTGTTAGGCVFLGYQAGYSETGANKLYISNTSTATPLIYGEFDTPLLKVAADIQPATDDTYYLGKNDDDTPFAWKGVILKDTTDGNYYRIEVVNGVVTATDLTD